MEECDVRAGLACAAEIPADRPAALSCVWHNPSTRPAQPPAWGAWGRALCVHAWGHLCFCKRACANAQVWPYVFACVEKGLCLCANMFGGVCLCVCTHRYVCLHACSHVCLCMSAYMWNVHMCVSTCTCWELQQKLRGSHYVCQPSHPKAILREQGRARAGQRGRQRARSGGAAGAGVGRCPRRPPLHVLSSPSGEVGSSPGVGKPLSLPQAQSPANTLQPFS